MTPRRVALLTGTLGTGGAERQVLTLAAHLDRREFATDVISLKHHGSLAGELAQLNTNHWSAAAGPGFDLAAVRRLAGRLRDARYDVVLATNQYCGTMLRLATLVGPRPPRLIAAFHSSPAHVGDGVRDRARLLAYRIALRGYDRLIYVGRRQRDEWLARGFAAGMPSDVIYNGVDVARFTAVPARDVRAELGWDRSHFVVGLCAALRREKRVLDLLDAAVTLVARGMPLRLLIIGDGAQRRAIEERVDALGLRAITVVTGLQPDVAPFIHACDVMTLVSAVEAFSIAVLEAMACGKPMVLTRVGGAAEQIEPGVSGYLVDVGKPQQIADRLAHIWHAGEAQRLGARARERVLRDFSLARMVEQYASVFRGEPLGDAAALGVAVAAGAKRANA
ncbi:glycosyltransferase [Ideonella sp. BN130291]|uniref:glycosyltransferase n=1 Tax=Ideonella sp. BN130291 TaxID=3112940 RepID=UPI002E263552|nr:glycosyltransferase [Ideonella sp. BN130291]